MKDTDIFKGVIEEKERKRLIMSLCKTIMKSREIEDKPFLHVDENRLKEWHLITDDSLTNAFVLLTTNTFVYSKSKVVVYGGLIEENIIGEAEIEGPIFQQLERIMKYIRRYSMLRVFSKYSQELPEEAIKELLINAYIHRDYNIEEEIKVELYDNRLVITSPGELYDLTYDELCKGYKSCLRNPLLAETFQHMGLMNCTGSGIPKVKTISEEYGLPSPRFYNYSHYLRATLFKKERVMDFIFSYGTTEDFDSFDRFSR